MRISGSLFTYAEMSASIHDSTFTAGDTPITTPNNKIVTVIDAVDMLHIFPLNGPNNRCPSWDELDENDVIGGGGLVASLTISGKILTANAYGGTPPYNFYFSCNPTGHPCSSFTIANPNQVNHSSPATTAITYGGYYADYQFQVTITDDVGHTAFDTTTVSECLTPDTPILMNDGYYRPLQSIQLADKLFDSTVMSMCNSDVSKLFIINGDLLKSSESHVHILFNGDLCLAKDLKVGMLLLDKDDNPVMIDTIEVQEGSFEVINISTDTQTYIANGIRTHNKTNCPG